MIRRCKICGKQLKKTVGDIGPGCLRKISGRKTKKIARLSRKGYLRQLRGQDMFGGDDE